MVECSVVQGTFSGLEIQAYMASAGNFRLVMVSPKKTRAGSLRIRMSMPTLRHWLCRTCWTSSRIRLPAVVMISRVSLSPAALWRMPFFLSLQPASSSRASALSGSWA